jgi:hypothetical protein
VSGVTLTDAHRDSTADSFPVRGRVFTTSGVSRMKPTRSWGRCRETARWLVEPQKPHAWQTLALDAVPYRARASS